MPGLQYVSVISPFQVDAGGELGPYPFDFYDHACLAQGDSWFSIGAIPPTLTTNVFAELQLRKSVVIVNCARPGMVLTRMADTTTESMFLRQLTGNLARKWDAILISGVGNDVIDAAQLPPTYTEDKRLLKIIDERTGDPMDGDTYISEAGWQTLANHITVVFDILVSRRNAGVNRDTPMLFHNYARLQPRPASAGLGFGPWLQPAFSVFAIPQNAWLAVSDALMNRADKLLQKLVEKTQALNAGGKLLLVNTRSANLTLADANTSGRSNDYQNEIHPTADGYEKIAAVWRTSLESLPGW